jgi:hypothetical protein
METNGVANIKMLVDQMKELYISENGKAISNITDKIEEQLLLLERYMLAYMDATDPNQMEQVPLWHEVRENPSKYPTANERISGFKKQMGG